MFVFLVPAILAGLLGLVAHQAGEGAAYVPRLRLMFLGAVALGYLGVAVFIWRKARGWKRWGALILALVALRVLYFPIVTTACLFTGWMEWAVRNLGAPPMGALIHYALACLTAAFASLAALLVVAVASHPKRVEWIALFLLFLVVGVLAFWHPGDRAVSPHPFADEGPQPATTGPNHRDVVVDGARATHTRILAACAGVRHLLSPRSGWGGVIRAELLSRFYANPDLSLRDRMTALEAAMRIARPELGKADDDPN